MPLNAVGRSSDDQRTGAVVRALPIAPTDVALLAALKAGDAQASAVLYDRYAPSVLRTLSSVVGTNADLPDLLNDVFLRAVQRIDRVTDASGLRPWLTAIAVLTAREYLRARARKRWLLFLPGDAVPDGVATTAAPEIRDAVRRLYGLLDKMSVADRLIFTLRYIDQKELAEVASCCETSLATAKRRLQRAEQRFLALTRKDPVLSEWLKAGGRWTT